MRTSAHPRAAFLVFPPATASALKSPLLFLPHKESAAGRMLV